MILGIDASNVRAGGGLSHLTNVLSAVDPTEFGFERVIVWGGRDTLSRIREAAWLEKVHEPALDGSLPQRVIWQWRRLPSLARESCDVLFAPGGNAPRGFAPLVTMSRNMLPFEWGELFRYRLSWITLRLLLLRVTQTRTLGRADGVIFLTRYAREAVGRVAAIRGRIATIPHGVEDRFRAAPRAQRAPEALTPERPLRLLYVSILDAYKHPWHVAEAVARLRDEGLAVEIDFVGPSYPPSLRRFERARRRLDPQGRFLNYRGALPYDELHRLRERAELFVFASSCENMPNILLEAMAQGFPIACAERGPMPEILGEGGVYFDPEAPASIADAIRSLAADPALRERSAALAHERSQDYGWERCARETFAFLRDVATG